MLILAAICIVAVECTQNSSDHTSHHVSGNSTDANKDMYVINAMVYQVGILTNKTENETAFNTTGNQESVTLFRNNGNLTDLSKIGHPLLTNVTAQSVVGVAPLADHANNGSAPWNEKMLHNLPPITYAAEEMPHQSKPRFIRNSENLTNTKNGNSSLGDIYKQLFRRDVTSSKPVAVHEGSAIIPPTAGVQSIAIPPLISFNSNLSNIPLPIPNTSVVHYAKINTLVTKP